MIDTKAIRGQILRLAFSAQLTSHNDSDDDVTELLSNINPKKKINQTENVPYEIPHYWKWVKLSDLYQINPKVEADNNADAAFIPMEKISAGFERNFSFDVMNWEKAAKNHTKFQNGDVAFAKISPCFENRKSFVAENLPNSIGGGTTELIVLRQRYVYPLYTYYLVNDQRFIKAGSGSYKGIVGQQRVKSDVIKSYLVPLPPLAEQKRIVERVEEIFRLLDAIDEAQEKYSADAESLKAKLITAGIQGKLTEQLDSDGTAEELYQQIQAEKQKLIKEGKIKKEKPLPAISDEEIPFEIPGNWKWVRLGEVFTLQAGKFISAAQISAEQDSDHQYKCFGGNGIRGYVSDYNTNGTHALIGRQGALCGNVNLAHDIFYATEHAVVVYQYCDVDVNWIFYGLTELNLNQYATSVAQPGLAVGKIEKVLIPLPPLAEQKRIAEVLERAMGVLE